MIETSIMVDRRREAKQGYPIKLYVRNGADRMYISTGMYVTDTNWKDGQYDVRKDSRARMKNAELRTLLNNVDAAVDSLGGRPVSKQRLKQIIESSISGKGMPCIFLDYAQEFLEKHEKPGTRQTILTMMNKVEEYDPAVTLNGIDLAWLISFEQWCIQKGWKKNYYGQLERNIKAVMNYCIDMEYTTNYPFRRFQCKKEETMHRSLTLEQVRILRDYPCEDYQEKYRDMFLLMIYMNGINAEDLLNLPPLKPGQDHVEFRRAKTGTIIKTKVFPEALEIIERYKGQTHLVNILEQRKSYVNFTHDMAKELKRIGPTKRVGRGGKKVIEPLFPDLSYYWSRHTFATLAAGLGIATSVIGRCLGHADSLTATIYINNVQQVVDDTTAAVINAINADR